MYPTSHHHVVGPYPHDHACNTKILTWREEMRLFLELVVPTIIVQLSATIPAALAISYIGRILNDIIDLDGCSLALVLVNVLCLSLIQGMLSASDTLSPQAFGTGNRRELGLILIRSYVACLLLIVPVNIISYFYLKRMLISIGEDPMVTAKAIRWYSLYMFVLPFTLLFNVLWRFLSSQEVMKPLVIVCTTSGLTVLPLSLTGLVRFIGYDGSIAALLIHQVTQVLLLLWYLKFYHPHYEGTWLGFSVWREAISWSRLRSYMSLGLGGVLAATEWCYWEIICVLAGSLGVIPFSVHTVPTQVLNVAYMIPLGFGVALNVRLAATIATDVRRAKTLLVSCYFISFIVTAILAYPMYAFRYRIFHWFTSDPVVQEGCDRIWFSVIVYFINLSIYGVNTGALLALGKQWWLGFITFVSLWFVALPASYYFSLLRAGGIESLWMCLYIPYIIVNIFLFCILVNTDWESVCLDVRKREGMDELPGRGFRQYGSI